ncbi:MULTISPECIES: BCCT family transporter [Corynebacterium]|uniref:BCCT family transporter n=1 Tax=Corynebacterium pseudogenitalium TaxID=38303 RepID=A0ABD4TMV8_9CORY|nr:MULTISPECIES: BCCT family transporter [Corynebacterium]MCQ4612155.1 BCCT family transporter [Corynebacterium sp. CCUG 51687]MCQ4613597.1 BCCT family transporter [Corynebacterium pseudogenitalium]MDK8363369.1 BCCT family transporter [Corynebacterium sp. UMB10119B]UUA87968.1 BCCT family transporter [Corynebacterium pseudogenitalium]
MSQGDLTQDPHDPDAETRSTEQINSDETEIAAPSATSELAELIVAERRGERKESVDAEEQVELAAEDENAKIDWSIVVPLLVVVAAVVAWGLLATDSFSSFADTSFSWVINNLGWAFVLFGTIFVFFVLVIAFSNFGTIRLGKSDEQPEFRTSSWIAMMFAAGMGIGLMFYGASEPLAMYRDGVPGHQPHEVGTALAQTMFHWSLHPWAIYAILGLAIAYSTFRLGRKQLLSSAFIPLIGEKGVNGFWGKLIDGFAIFATIFGTACSLGLGAMQISSGLNASGFVDSPSTKLTVGIVSVLTLAFLLSAMSGVGKGIQWLSNFNMAIAALLAIFVFVFGPTVSTLNFLPTGVGAYLSQFFEMAGRTAENQNGEAGDFLSGWTIFYWAWWISWSPFVGTFLARISRGRTIREFCLGVMLIPAGLSTVWFAIFGGTAIKFEQDGRSIYGEGTSEEQLFNLLHQLPGGFYIGIFAVILLGTFFITSADSASTVMASMSQNGKSDANPWIAAVWGLGTAFVGLTLLIAGGSDALGALQSVTIVAATPFLLILILLMFAIVKDVSNDTIYLDKKEQDRFNRQLAIERRMHRDQLELDRKKEQVKRMLRPRN